jgi:hypothetical protein
MAAAFVRIFPGDFSYVRTKSDTVIRLLVIKNALERRLTPRLYFLTFKGSCLRSRFAK